MSSVPRSQDGAKKKKLPFDLINRGELLRHVPVMIAGGLSSIADMRSDLHCRSSVYTIAFTVRELMDQV